jgi:ABC-type Fe3+ transport system permease subunit
MEASQATTALVLGILSIVLCQILGPFAWAMGNTEMKAIDAGRRPPENRGTANAAKILGIIGTVLLIIGVLVAIFVVAMVAITGVTYSEYWDEFGQIRALLL